MTLLAGKLCPLNCKIWAAPVIDKNQVLDAQPHHRVHGFQLIIANNLRQGFCSWQGGSQADAQHGLQPLKRLHRQKICSLELRTHVLAWQNRLRGKLQYVLRAAGDPMSALPKAGPCSSMRPGSFDSCNEKLCRMWLCQTCVYLMTSREGGLQLSLCVAFYFYI